MNTILFIFFIIYSVLLILHTIHTQRTLSDLRYKLHLSRHHLAVLHEHYDRAEDEATLYFTQLRDAEHEIERLNETTAAACEASGRDLATLCDVRAELNDALDEVRRITEVASATGRGRDEALNALDKTNAEIDSFRRRLNHINDRPF